MAAGKCVHRGCGKTFEDENEDCFYHPQLPDFHEGQKGWKCCKPRVLEFDEFMKIPPCTKGKHSTVDDTPAPEPKPAAEEPAAKPVVASEQSSAPAPSSRMPISTAATPKPATAQAPVEDETDDPDAVLTKGMTCKRNNCGVKYDGGDRTREQCVHHPGHAIFHEGSKGWGCCKKRVLDFDEFTKMPGCTTKDAHLFVGPKKDGTKEEMLDSVRSDFYQTGAKVMASLYLKKIDKATSTVKFSSPTTIDLDLKTLDNKRFKQEMTLFGSIDPETSSFKIMGTKLEFELVKSDGAGWPVLRADDRHTGEIIQTGQAGRA